MQVWLTRMDGHMGLANSLAMKLAGITNSSIDPNGGTIVKSVSGGNGWFCCCVKMLLNFCKLPGSSPLLAEAFFIYAVVELIFIIVQHQNCLN